MNEETQVARIEAPELKLVEKSKADKIRETFKPMVEMLDTFDEAYNKLMSIPKDDVTIELTEEYKRLRLDMGKVRIATGKLKDKQKEYIKLEDKAIMGVHNILVWAVKEKEDNLKEREDHFKIKAKKERDELQAKRVLELTPYVEDAAERLLYGMADDVWSAYLTAKKTEHTDKLAAEKKIEDERLAAIAKEKAEQERIRKENEKLKAEAVERERIAKVEEDKRLKEEQERKAKEDAERIDREAKEKKQREEYEAKLKAEREENDRVKREEEAKRQKLQDELKAKEDAEKLAEEQKAALLQSELNKGDAAKVKDLLSDLEELKTKYSFKSAKNKVMYKRVVELLDKVKEDINKH